MPDSSQLPPHLLKEFQDRFNEEGGIYKTLERQFPAVGMGGYFHAMKNVFNKIGDEIEKSLEEKEND